MSGTDDKWQTPHDRGMMCATCGYWSIEGTRAGEILAVVVVNGEVTVTPETAVKVFGHCHRLNIGTNGKEFSCSDWSGLR